MTKPQHRIALVVSATLSCLSLLAGQDRPKKKKTYTDSEVAAKEDAGFLLQGEYAEPGTGLQIIALGNDRFRLVTYEGGLPGLGFDRKSKGHREVSGSEARREIARGYQKIHRHSTTRGAKPPEGAVVIFDGTEASRKNWKKGARITKDGLLMEGATSVPTFGNALVHVEFRLPYKPHARSQGRGNSGLYLQGRYETQILDSFGLDGKHNECGGIYSVRDPDLNMCLPPLTWQTYDIEFTAAEFDAQGKKTKNARMTVRLNGVVIHEDVEVPKRTTASPLKEGPTPGPIFLQNHGNPVRFRNIWVLPRS